jgi:peptidoglycan/LPS O-acetylase OafA/YrhL
MVLAPTRFLFVDALRGLAALSVAVFHLGPNLFGLSWLRFGGYGVIMFFVISGFVISHSLASKRVTGEFLASFVLKRSIRLDPAYWVAIALAILLVWVPGLFLHHDVKLPVVGDVILHIFYLQGFFDVATISVVFWTLCYEVQFYLVFCLMLYLANISDRFALNQIVLVFSPLFLMSLLWPMGIVSVAPRGLFVNLWYLFLLGAFARWAYESRLAVIVLFLSAFMLLSSLFVSGSENLSLLVGPATAILLFVAISAEKMQQWLSWAWIQRLGQISYSLYLVHDIIGLHVRDTAAHLALKYFGWSSLAINYFWCVGALAVSIVAADILYKYVECPSHALSRKLDIRSVKVGIVNMLNYPRGRS